MSKKHIIIIFLFTVVSASIYITFQDRFSKKEEISKAVRLSNDNSISNLMKSLYIQEVTSGMKAPDFKLQSLEGDWVNLNQYHGKVVLLNFWATW